ncbi:MAG TPA: T9SS type A sorting domain-containing protein, partial [Flavobacteriales bacterium]
AYDPNDKAAQPIGIGEEHLTALGTNLLYTIRFQNTGNATAHDVVLIDTLDAALDPATLRIAGSSHAHHALVSEDGVVRFTFNNIMLPDSGTDMLASNGYITYKIDHRPEVEEGTRVENTAAIYFDLNPPVITNTTWNTLGTLSTGVEEKVIPLDDDAITVFPNPAQGSTTVRFGNAFKGRVQVDLLDATGRLIRTVNRRSDTVTITGNDLPSGLYFLRAVSDDGNGIVRTARVIFER